MSAPDPDRAVYRVDPAVDGDVWIVVRVQPGDLDVDVDQVAVIEFDASRLIPDLRAYPLRMYQVVELHAALGKAIAVVRREGRSTP